MSERKRLAFAWLLTVLAGSGLHFLYPLLPLPLTALFAPVNESVWEHLKLLYWPFLAAAAVWNRRKPAASWGGWLAALLLQPAVLASAYYLLEAGFGITSLWVDIGLYAAVLAGGFAAAPVLSRRVGNELGLLIVLASIYGVCLAVFSLAAPALPIFTPPA